MKCMWKELLDILPQWMRGDVDRLGKENLQELRLRINAPPELILNQKRIRLERSVSREDVTWCVNAASRYSPWAAATIADGYITSPGGHRIGLCGEAVVRDGHMTGIREINALCIRVARDFPGIGRRIAEADVSLLILGAPGWGKTTLLRDIARAIAKRKTVAVVDERRELFPGGSFGCEELDVLHGCSKAEGIEALLRTMGPECIVVDEITAQRDTEALAWAGGCGVQLIASAHGTSLKDWQSRGLAAGLFSKAVILHRDRSFSVEEVAA